MKRAISVVVLVLLLGAAFGAAASRDKPPSAPPQSATNLGILKLYPSKESEGVLLNADSPPRVFLDGNFVGNYRDLNQLTPACFHLPAGKHTVRVEFGSKDFSPFQAEIHLIGNESTQYLCVTTDFQEPEPTD